MRPPDLFSWNISYKILFDENKQYQLVVYPAKLTDTSKFTLPHDLPVFPEYIVYDISENDGAVQRAGGARSVRSPGTVKCDFPVKNGYGDPYQSNCRVGVGEP
jgi:hypothetical protein